MTPTREEVERLVSEVTAAFPNNDYGGSDEALRMGAVPVDASACMETAAMLRALLDRAEAAEAELAVEQEARELASESDAGWEQVANAAQAEAARLRKALTEARSYLRPPPSSHYPHGVTYVVQAIDAALATDARDE